MKEYLFSFLVTLLGGIAILIVEYKSGWFIEPKNPTEISFTSSAQSEIPSRVVSAGMPPVVPSATEEKEQIGVRTAATSCSFKQSKFRVFLFWVSLFGLVALVVLQALVSYVDENTDYVNFNRNGLAAVLFGLFIEAVVLIMLFWLATLISEMFLAGFCEPGQVAARAYLREHRFEGGFSTNYLDVQLAIVVCIQSWLTNYTIANRESRRVA